MGGYPAAKAAFEAAERAYGDPGWDRDWSCLALGDSVGPAVFVTGLRTAMGISLAAAAIGITLAFSSAPAFAKTAAQCNADYAANKAAIKASGQTKKAYVAACRA